MPFGAWVLIMLAGRPTYDSLASEGTQEPMGGVGTSDNWRQQTTAVHRVRHGTFPPVLLKVAVNTLAAKRTLSVRAKLL